MKGGYFEKPNAQVLSKNIKTSKEILRVVGGVVTTHKSHSAFWKNKTLVISGMPQPEGITLHIIRAHD
jgi:hypothetical protein